LRKLFLLSFVALLLLAGCSAEQPAISDISISTELPTEEPVQLSWTERLALDLENNPLPDYSLPEGNGKSWYEVFVWSYRDSNGDGVGDINGVTQSLDYIQNMGFDGIWLMPVHPSPTYHKYDVKDYYAIDPVYGTMEDFDNLLLECKKRNISVIMDFVLNHTSDEHPWFLAAKAGDEKYRAYYHIQEEAGNGQWKQLSDGSFYECQFWDKMPDLNLYNEDLRLEFTEMFKFWLDKGVAGFRLDAVKEYETGNVAANIEILSWINETVKSIKPDAYIVGENWDTTSGIYRYYESGIDSFFSFPFANADGITAKTIIMADRPVTEYIQKLKESDEAVKAESETATRAQFFTNHDNARSVGFMRRNAELFKTAWGMTILEPGDLFIYYGEEIAMSGSGKDENKRAPFYWTDEESAAGNGPPDMEQQQNTFSSVIDQLEDENSILNYIRKAVRLRHKYPNIGRGSVELTDMEVVSGNEVKIGGAVRTWEDYSNTIVYNISDQPAEVKFSGKIADFLSATGTEPTENNGVFSLPPYSMVIIN
jgi:glycosidase